MKISLLFALGVLIGNCKLCMHCWSQWDKQNVNINLIRGPQKRHSIEFDEQGRTRICG